MHARLLIPLFAALALPSVQAADTSNLLKAGVSLLGNQTTQTSTKTAETTQTSLVSALTSQLGVTEQQATGGAGALLELATKKLSASDTASLKDAIPNLDDLIAAAPDVATTSTDSSSSLLGKASGLLGNNSSLQTLSSLAPAFEALGLDASMVQQFVPVLLQYVGDNGSSDLVSSLKSALLGS